MRLIDADKLEDVLAKHQTHYYGDSDYYEGISQGFNLAIYDVKEAQTIDAEPIRHGKWIVEADATVMHCNSCGWAYEYYAGLEEEWNYCSHCGAKMEIENETD